MCGLFGFQSASGKLPGAAVAVAVMACHMDERGGDSFGYMADGAITRGLGTMSAGDVPAARLGSVTTLMAHTRNATTGAVSVENAHPFSIGRIVGAHNGIVFNHADLNRTLGRDCAVDSMHIFQSLSESRPLSEIQAYGAITFVNARRPHRLYLGRFNHGQLSVARLFNGPKSKARVAGIMWASTRNALVAALSLADLRYDMVEITNGALYRVQGGEIYPHGKVTISAAPVKKVTTIPKHAAMLPGLAALEARAFRAHFDADSPPLAALGPGDPVFHQGRWVGNWPDD